MPRAHYKLELIGLFPIGSKWNDHTRLVFDSDGCAVCVDVGAGNVTIHSGSTELRAIEALKPVMVGKSDDSRANCFRQIECHESPNYRY